MKQIISIGVLAAALFSSIAAHADSEVDCPQGQDEFIGAVKAVQDSDCGTKWAIKDANGVYVAANLPAQFQHDHVTVYGCYIPVKNALACKVDGEEAAVVTLTQIHLSLE